MALGVTGWFGCAATYSPFGDLPRAPTTTKTARNPPSKPSTTASRGNQLIVDKQKVPLNKPPAFISCANDDPLMLATPSVQIYQDWISAGAEAELHMFSKGGHGYGMNKINAPVDRWSQLLIDWILAL